MKTLEGLEGVRDGLEVQLEAVKKQIETLKLQAIAEKWGITVGDTVISEGEEYEITHIDTYWQTNGKPWLKGVPKNQKAVGDGISRRMMSDWEEVPI